MKKIRQVINAIRFDFIVGIIIFIFIGERSRLVAIFGGIFLLLSVVEFILQFLCEIGERRKNGESYIYKAKSRRALREVRGKVRGKQPVSEMRDMREAGSGEKGKETGRNKKEIFLDEEKGRP